MWIMEVGGFSKKRKDIGSHRERKETGKLVTDFLEYFLISIFIYVCYVSNCLYLSNFKDYNTEYTG
jgi:hypothetical protein